jgi:Kef-type K+ transport system membrane component KefB
MSEQEIGSLTLVLVLILGLAHLFGHLFSRLHQPRVIGEILAGLIIGPSVLGNCFPALYNHLFQMGTPAGVKFETVISFLYNLGLLMLMFSSGAKIRELFTHEERRAVGYIVSVGTGIPFLLALVAGQQLNLQAISGPNGNKLSLIIVLAIGVAVTSIPVIARIFADLKILHTRFARVVLGVAVIEDIILWGALAVATALASKTALSPLSMGKHLITTSAFFVLGLTLLPRLIKRVNQARWNILARHSPVAYVIAVLLAYCAVASALHVSLVFAAFLAGYAIIHNKRQLFAEPMDLVEKMGFSVFVPIYFAIVGYRLDLSMSFSLGMLTLFLVGSCILKLISVSLGAHLAGFRGLDMMNLAIATNARGGPGIVLASVAYDAGIINPVFYTTLVLAAVLTSQAAGVWLEYVLRKSWPLLSTEQATSTTHDQVASGQTAI